MTSPPTPQPPGLEVRRNRVVTWAVAAAVAVVSLLFGAWFVTHPATLATRDGHVTAVTTAGRAVYVGVYTAPADAGRTLHVAGVHVSAESTVPVEIEPLLCRAGSVNVTSDPAPFCRSVEDPAGADLAPGDSLVLRVVAEDPGAVYVARVQVGYRDGLRRGTQPAGTESVIAVLAPTP